MSGRRQVWGDEARQLKILRKRAYIAQKGLCCWCGNKMEPGDATAEHIEPLFLGGKTKPGNIAACAKCNNERNSEANRGSGGLVATTEEIFRSPFEKLKR